MAESAGRRALPLPLGAAVAGFAWGYLEHRSHPRRTSLALMQCVEWFIACGGAAVLVQVLRSGLDPDDLDELTERVTHSLQTVTDRSGR